MSKTYYLIPGPKDGVKSFYNKASVILHEDGSKYLKSYDTVVAGILADGTKVRFYGKDDSVLNANPKATVRWASAGYNDTCFALSKSTLRHIYSFMGLRRAEFLELPLSHYRPE